MKQVLPFIFPAVALAIVLFLAVRWYGNRTDRPTGDIFGEGMEIEELSEADKASVMKGTGDYETVALQASQEITQPALGQIRYEVTDGKVKFSVSAELPKDTAGRYQVWLKDLNSSSLKKAFVLSMTKGGYGGSGAISADLLPFQVIVSQETNDDEKIEKTILSGTINKAGAQPSESK